MTVFLILAPYGAFAALMLVTSAAISLFVSAGICLAVIAFDIWRGRSIKILGAGSVLTFAETAKLPGFIRANYIISWTWAAASALMMMGNAAMIYVPWLPFWGGLVVAFAARNCAIYFTKWYPQYRRAKYGTPPASALPRSQ